MIHQNSIKNRNFLNKFKDNMFRSETIPICLFHEFKLVWKFQFWALEERKFGGQNFI